MTLIFIGLGISLVYFLFKLLYVIVDYWETETGNRGTSAYGISIFLILLGFIWEVIKAVV